MFWLNFSGFVSSYNVMVLFCGVKWWVVTMLSMFHVCLSKIRIPLYTLGVMWKIYSYVIWCYVVLIWCVGNWHYIGLFAILLNCVRSVNTC